MKTGTVYTEAVVHSAPEAFIHDAPYQTAIVTLDESGAERGAEGGRITGRILGERVRIGDRVVLVETREGVAFFRKS
jgi:uncharacterized OB-fold protein